MQYKGFKRIKRAAAVILSAALIVTELPAAGTARAAEAEYETQTAAGQDIDPAQPESAPEDSGQPPAGSEHSQPESSAPEAGEREPETESAETETVAEPSSPAITEPETGSAVEAETGTQASDSASEGEDEDLNTEITETEIIETETVETETATSEAAETENSTTEAIETETASTETETMATEATETETVGTEATETETTEEITEEETLELEGMEETSVPVPEVDASVHNWKAARDLAAFRVPAPKAYASVQNPVEITPYEYRIENRDQFLGFLSGRSDYDGCTVTLACNVDMKSETAYFGGRFSGIFDGNGYSVQNLKVDQGLFPVLQSGAVVKNLHISNASMTGEYSAGVIAGRNDGTITNCVVTGSLEAGTSMDYTAGIVGVNEGTVEECVFSGRITAAAGTEDAEKDIGGIAGRNNGVIRNCYASGSIQTKAAVVAGIVGTNTSREPESIKGCVNYMSVEGAYIVAGIVGINEGEVTDCTNYGSVRQKNHSQEIGEAGGIAAQNKIGTMSDCYNYASVSGEDKNIGGIAATTSGTITRCGNSGSVTGLANVGGVAGLYNGNREYSIS